MARTIAVTGARGARQGAVAAALSRAGHVVRGTPRTSPPSGDSTDVDRRVADLVGGEGLDAALAAPLDVVTLEPTVYLDNLLAPWALPGILERGTLAYPAPADAPISWLSLASLGEHARAALGAPAGDRVAELYRALDERPDTRSPSAPDPFGVDPGSIEDFAARAFPGG